MARRTVLIASDQARAFINKNAWRYLDVLKNIKGLLTGFRFSEQGRNAVYAIYSRGERQRGGDELKDAWQVKEKVNKMREEGDPDHKPQLPPNPNFPIQDVGDIIALTAVCVYPSDIDDVRTFIGNHQGLNVIDEEEKKEEGYQAVHFVLGLNDRKYAGIRCELQVKTILHDAWSARTHDLIYKPQGSVLQDAKEQLEIMSKHLTPLDKASEKLKQQIEKLWDRDKKRKEACTMRLLRATVAREPSDGRRKRAYRAILKNIHKKEPDYRKGNVSKVLDRIEKFTGTTYDSYSCKLMTYLAAIRATDDLDHIALDYIDRAAARSVTRRFRVGALVFKGLALYCFNRLPEAVETTEEALETAKRHRLRDQVVECKVNLAHYLAEMGRYRDGRIERGARGLMDEVVDAVNGETNLAPNRKDTLGFVKIVFGRSQKEVNEGRTLCRQAYDASPNDEVARAFFELHDEIADERLKSPELPKE